jgi:uncharacterized membrane protein YphA (DoxX/SURF4 family)
MSSLQNRAVLLLRITFGVLFLWFGALKLFAAGDSLALLQNALPASLAFSQLFSFAVSFLEIALGIAFLTNKFVKVASAAAFFELFITAVLILVTQGFDPRFPVLSIEGESALKNIVLSTGALILALMESEKKDPTEHPSH